MNIAQAMAVVDQGQLDGAYLLSGDRSFWARRWLKAARRRWLGDDRDPGYRAIGGALNWAEVLLTLSSGGLFGSRQMLLVEDGQWSKKEESLARYLEQPMEDILLVVWERRPSAAVEKIFGPRRTITLKELAPDAFLQFLQDEAKARNLTITRTGLGTLAEFVAGDEYHAVNELDKMMLYDGGRRWDGAGVASFAVRGGQDHAVWDLTDPILARNRSQSVHQVQRLLNEGKPPIMLLVSMARQLGALGRAWQARQKGQTLDEFQRIEGLKPYPAKKLWKAAEGWDILDIRRALQRALWLDKALKTGYGDAGVWLVTFVASLGKGPVPSRGRPHEA